MGTGSLRVKALSTWWLPRHPGTALKAGMRAEARRPSQPLCPWEPCKDPRAPAAQPLVSEPPGSQGPGHTGRMCSCPPPVPSAGPLSSRSSNCPDPAHTSLYLCDFGQVSDFVICKIDIKSEGEKKRGRERENAIWTCVPHTVSTHWLRHTCGMCRTKYFTGGFPCTSCPV